MATGARVSDVNSIGTLSDATWAAWRFDTEAYDYGNLWVSGANDDRLTPPTKGVYALSLWVKFPSNSTGHRGARIVTNNGTILVQDVVPALGASLATHVGVNTLFEFDPLGSFNVYMKAEIWQTSGAGMVPVSVEFAAHLVEAT